VRRAVARAIEAPRLLSKVLGLLLKYSGQGLILVAALLGLNTLFQPATISKIQIFDERLIVFAVVGAFASVVLRIMLFAADVLFYFNESKPIDFAKTFPDLPVLESTKRFLERKNLEQYAVGSAVEVFSHPYLDKRLSDNGWDPKSVRIVDRRAPLKDLRIPSSIAEHRARLDITGDNGIKYTLQGFNHPFTDSSKSLNLYIAETDWRSVLSARALLMRHEEFRHESLDITLQDNRIPSSLCLHFVCLTKDDKFLALKRSSATAYYPNALSISFEEQFSHEDMKLGEERRAEVWFQRALCEEVFPMAGPYHAEPRAAWDEVSSHVDFMRIWSCFLEEDTGNFSLFGVCRLLIESPDLLQTFKEQERRFHSRRDDEGQLYILNKDEVEALTLSGHSTCRRLYFPNNGSEVVSDLHPTSLYRASQVLSCM
jgi:hypothetical protein